MAMGMIISRAEFGGTPDADVIKDDPLELLMRLRSVTAARYAGEETIREARCRKIAVAVSGTTAVPAVWADGGHVRKIQAVTQKTTERMGVTVLATATVTVQLWDFGVPVDSVGWPPLPPPAGRALPVFQRRLRLHPPRSQARGFPGQVSNSWSKAARRPVRICLIEECGYERVGGSMAYNKESLSVRPGAGVPPGLSGPCSGAPGRGAASRRPGAKLAGTLVHG